MRRPLAVVALALVMGAGAAAVPTVAVAGPAAPSVSVTPDEASPGTPLQIEGSCGVAQDGVAVFIGFEINGSSVTLGEVTTDGSGAFSLDAPAPQLAPPTVVPGTGEIAALCDLGSDSVRVTTPFTLLDGLLELEPPVDPAPVVELDPRFTG